MRAAICDDEEVFRNQVKEALNEFLGKLDNDYDEYEDGLALLQAVLSGYRPDVIFLDIEMQHMDGMAVAHELKKANIDIPVIFLTSHTELAMDGYEVQAFRFLGKPIQTNKLAQTLQDLHYMLYTENSISIRSDGEEVILSVADIMYVEAQNNSVRIVTNRQNYLTRMKLAAIVEEIDSLTHGFVQIHRCYAVNLSCVKKHKAGEVTLTGDVILPLGRSHAKEFRYRLFNYISKTAR